MDAEANVVIPNFRCAPFHAALAVDPVGSTGNYDAYLCVEVPLPWERDISSNHPFASICDAPSATVSAPDGRRWRPQGLVPAEGRNGMVQVLAFEQRDRAKTGVTGRPFDRREWILPPDLVVTLCSAVIGSDAEACAVFDEYLIAPATSPGIDLFVCTHGQRDVCCGGSGTALYTALDQWATRTGSPAEHLRVRRVSHTGGHRFAPTAMTFPDGYGWSHLDQAVALSITSRSVEPSEVLGHIRGSTLFKGGPAQAADRHGLGIVGWEWARSPREVSLLGFDRRTMATDLNISGELSDGTSRSFEVRVGIERYVPQITCGEITKPEYKVEPVWQVQDAREV